MSEYESLKPQLRDTRLELQRRHAQLNFWTREIQDCQKQIRDSTMARWSPDSFRRRELQAQLHQLQANRDTGRQAYEVQKVEYERIYGQLQGHKERINVLMRELSLHLSNTFSTL